MCRTGLKRGVLTELIKLKKVGAFRAERTVKVVPLELIELGKRVHSEKVGAFRANRTEKVGAFRGNKTQKGGLYPDGHDVTKFL